ncbi:MAG: hypothetical protein HQK65_13150 [Desulfamplus sp.]|nr:hypothetical protein [Desulfamplus sp.]
MQMNRTQKMLICTPDLTKAGGVSNYYRVIKNNCADDFDFFEAGGKARSILGVISAIFEETNAFVKTLIYGNYNIVLLNPSLLSRAIIRNAVFLLIAKLLGKKSHCILEGVQPECPAKN